jgi:hypothetical protein
MQMSWERPAWYMTTDEFANLIVESLHEQNYFKKGERVHPEDIVAAFTSTAESIAKGAGFAGKKMYNATQEASKS